MLMITSNSGGIPVIPKTYLLLQIVSTQKKLLGARVGNGRYNSDFTF